MPTVVNGRNTFPGESGVGNSSEDSEENLGYNADESFEVGGSFDDSFDTGSLRDQPLEVGDGSEDGEEHYNADESMDLGSEEDEESMDDAGIEGKRMFV